jgi:hypothetical protein
VRFASNGLHGIETRVSSYDNEDEAAVQQVQVLTVRLPNLSRLPQLEMAERRRDRLVATSCQACAWSATRYRYISPSSFRASPNNA